MRCVSSKSIRLPEGPKRHRAIHRAGIDIGKSQALGETLGDGALARARGPVDGNYDTLRLNFGQDLE